MQQGVPPKMGLTFIGHPVYLPWLTHGFIDSQTNRPGKCCPIMQMLSNHEFWKMGVQKIVLL